MTTPKNISIQDYTYHLPSDRIALHPLPERDASRLLIYRDGHIQEDVYRNIARYLPEGSTLVFNKTKVINARLLFQKPTGGTIEVFCLEPAEDNNDYSSVMSQCGKATWLCMAGNAAKWKEESLKKRIGNDDADDVLLRARRIEKRGEAWVIEFTWKPEHISFAEILDMAGDIPLPPYIKRQTINDDKNRYQTIYAEHEGSVAAPTAGLHFTQPVFEDLTSKDIRPLYVTLHVGAGTFRPVKASVMEDHIMHAEWIDVDATTIRDMLSDHEQIIAVGTTSLRTIETLYWLGVKAHIDPLVDEPGLGQWDVYESPLCDTGLDVPAALQSLLHWMESHGRKHIFTQTQLLITPGYKFRMAKALITNFHQPQSTLLLLVAAAAGHDWRKIYDHALNNDFRFLSYGDGSLIFMAG